MKNWLPAALAMAPTANAWATDGLTWEWAGPRHYYIEADVTYPFPILLQEENNKETQLFSMITRVDTTCAPFDKPGKSSLEIRCTLNDLAMSAVPLESYRGKTVEVLDATEAALAHGYMQIQLGFDGRIRSIDLEGLETKGVNMRVQATQEQMRLVLTRAFAALDLQLPPKGDDGGQAWTQTGSSIVALPSTQGASGVVPITIAVARTADSLVTLSVKTLQDGVIGSGETFLVNGVEQMANTYATSVKGFASFDTSLHAMVARRYEVVETPTPSSTSAVIGHPYLQTVTLTLVKDGDPPPQPGPNEERTE